MTYLGHHLILTYLDLRSSLTLTFQGHIIHDSTRFDETKNTMLPKPLLYLLNQRRYRRKNFLVDIDLLTSGDLSFNLS